MAAFMSSFLLVLSFFDWTQCEILPHTTEHRLGGLPAELSDVFNDLSLHVFNVKDNTRSQSDDDLWTECVDEPRYQGNDFDQEIVWTKQSQDFTQN